MNDTTRPPTPPTLTAGAAASDPLTRGATLRQLRAFALVARHRSFARAAEELHLSPSAVSLQIRELETATGTPLFDRQAKAVSLTRAGELALMDVQDALQSIQHAGEALARLRRSGEGGLAVGMVSSASYFLPRLLARFRAGRPDLDLQLLVGNRDRMLDALRHGEVDLAVMGEPPPELADHAQPIASLPLGMIAAPEHELAQARAIAPAALSSHPFILREPGSGTRAALERFLREQHIELPRRREMPGNDAVKQAVMANLGIAFISLQAAALELRGGLLVALDVIGLPVQRRWYAVAPNPGALNHSALDLRGFLVEQGTQIGGLVPRGAAEAGEAARPLSPA